VTQSSLSVLVSAACTGCVQALALATEFQRLRPDVPLEIVDVDAPGWQPPPGFAGTPMFYVGDTLMSYGNPELSALLAAFPIKAVRT